MDGAIIGTIYKSRCRESKIVVHSPNDDYDYVADDPGDARLPSILRIRRATGIENDFNVDAETIFTDVKTFCFWRTETTHRWLPITKHFITVVVCIIDIILPFYGHPTNTAGDYGGILIRIGSIITLRDAITLRAFGQTTIIAATRRVRFRFYLFLTRRSISIKYNPKLTDNGYITFRRLGKYVRIQ